MNAPARNRFCSTSLHRLLAKGIAAALTATSPGPTAGAEEPAAIEKVGASWILQNKALQATVTFAEGKLAFSSLINREGRGIDYLRGRSGAPLFSHRVDNDLITAGDGGWHFESAKVVELELFGRNWGKRLEVTLNRSPPSAVSIRQVFEIYNDRAGIRVLSFLKNESDQPLAITASDVLALNLPDDPHRLHFVTGNLHWNTGTAGLHRGGRNAIACYDAGGGWFVVPENNWATCLVPGAAKGDAANKFLHIHVWDNEPVIRVSTNPAAVQLTLFPHEEIEYFSVNLGVFAGDAMDGRAAVAEHLRLRFKFHDPVHILSTNDWQWGNGLGRRTEKNYREVVVPKARDAGFDRVLFDDGWYAPDDSATPKPPVANMAGIAEFIEKNGLKTGHWFSLQGRFCTRGWGQGRDAADPANIDFKLNQMETELIGNFRSTWDQVDAGLLWKTDVETPYSHPKDSVYRKVLGMKRYMNTIARKHPDFIMQTTCEIDNPGGSAKHGEGAQNVGLIQLADNGIMGMYRRSEYADDVRDLFAAFGLFPLEGMLSTHGEDGIRADSWQDSPLWYYQFLLARHTMIYSWPGDWSRESVAHLRVFNDWRKNPRIRSLLNKGVLPVYNGPDPVKNEGPWCWMFTNETRTQALVFAINHRELNPRQAFDAKLRWLDAGKSYLIEEITQSPDGTFNYRYRGSFPGKKLIAEGLPVDLDAGEERCAAFYLQENNGNPAQVLYADAAILRFDEKMEGGQLVVRIEGAPGRAATLLVAKAGRTGVEERSVLLDAAGAATVRLDPQTITQSVCNLSGAPLTTNRGARDASTAGAWNGSYGGLAAWIAGRNLAATNGFSLSTGAPVYVWNKGDASIVPRVLDVPAGSAGPKKAACWTTTETFQMRVNAPAGRRYRLSVYVMDYDNGQRGMDITVKTRDGSLHDRQGTTVAEMGGGIYLSWEVTGPATILARKNAGFNATVSGIFTDPPTP